MILTPVVQGPATGYVALQMASTLREMELLASPFTLQQTRPLRVGSHCRIEQAQLYRARQRRGVCDRALREHRRPTGYRSFLLCQMLKHISDTSSEALRMKRNVYVFADRKVVVR
jgi:hypothetical protein